MAFAKAYREEITLAYYCFNLALTIAFFIFGTMYLRHRDRRDQRRQEWRQFAETVRSEYSKLKAGNILYKISKVKDIFGNIQIHTEITGLDVLRYMIDSDFESFKTTELRALCQDLDSIFQLLNSCASLILLGAVPNNIRAELGKLVTKLVEITLPFYKGEERSTILKCLKHFGSDGKVTVKTERRVRITDTRFEEVVPYVHCLRFEIEFQLLVSAHMHLDYGKCNKFTWKGVGLDSKYKFLTMINVFLEEEGYKSHFARTLRECPPSLQYIHKIMIDSDSDELVLGKVLHEVRVYIHLISKERKALDAELDRNIEILSELYERAKYL